MKLPSSRVLPVLSFPVLVFAHSHNNPHFNRQASAAASSAATPSSAAASSVAASSATVASSAASSVSSSTANTGFLSTSGTFVTSFFPTPTGPTPSFTLVSENPTAVPLSSIVVNAPPVATSPLPPAYAVGAKPSNFPNAPGLPDISTISAANYPPLDRPPPTDSPEVLAWIQEVSQTGVTIPNITATVTGGCLANPEAATDSTRCWWTCGGCTRSTDVTTCPAKLQWGLTYDDGPSYYTPYLLPFLSQYNLLSTMFVVGSRVISFPSLLQEEFLAGHQIAVHTWSHYPLTTLTNEQIIAELGWTKKVIRDVLGVTPTVMRPPYGDIDDRVRAICTAMNLVPVMWTRINTTATFDTDDFNIHNGMTNVQQVLFNWENIMQNVMTMNTGFIVLEHDLFQQTVEVATGYILPDALARQPALNITTVNSCLNRPPGDAYLETNDNSSNPLPLSAYPGASGGGSGSSKKNGAVAGTIARLDTLAVVAAGGMLGAMVPLL